MLGGVLSTSLFACGDAVEDSAAIAPAAVAYGMALEVLHSINNEAALGKALAGAASLAGDSA